MVDILLCLTAVINLGTYPLARGTPEDIQSSIIINTGLFTGVYSVLFLFFLSIYISVFYYLDMLFNVDMNLSGSVTKLCSLSNYLSSFFYASRKSNSFN